MSPLPEVTTTLSGTTIAFPPNSTQIQSIRLRFTEPEVALLEVAIANEARPPIIATVGLDGVYRFSPGEFGLPQAARGAWTDEEIFVIEYTTIANDDAYLLRLRLEKDATVTLALMDRTRGATVQVAGGAINHSPAGP